MLLLGSFGDGRMYVSFIIERGTWRFESVVMIDVVVEELEMLVIDYVVLFRALLICNTYMCHNHARSNICL